VSLNGTYTAIAVSPDVVSLAIRRSRRVGTFNAAIKGSYDCRAAQSNEALGFK